MADFEQVENCISFAENEGYTEWAKGAEDELTLYRVRLSAAEQERRDLQESVRNLNTVYENCCATRLAAEARAEAAEQALSKIAYPARSDWLPGEWPEVIRRMQAIARAALAGREESHDCRCDGNPSGGSCAYPDCKLPPPTTEELLGLAGREEPGGG